MDILGYATVAILVIVVFAGWKIAKRRNRI